VRITREIVATTRRLADELASTPGLRIVGVPEVSLVISSSKTPLINTGTALQPEWVRNSVA
jgi:hypothetical protein